MNTLPITSDREWLTEKVAWVFGLFCIPYLAIFKIAGLETASQFVIPTVMVYVVTIFLNRAGLASFARMTLIVGTSASLFYYSNLLGEAAGAHLLLFAIVPLPLLLFESKNWIGIVLGLLIPIGTGLFLKWNQFSFINVHEEVTPEVAKWISLTAQFTTFGLLAVSVLMYYIANRRYEALLERQNEDLLKHRALLEESWKAATYAQLMRNIAHEIKNPLFAISLTLSTLEDDFDNPNELKNSIDVLDATTTDLMHIVDVMLETGSAASTPSTKISLTEITNRILLLFRTRLHKKGIDWISSFSPDIPEIALDSKSILLILSNLITNAEDAMSEGGTLKITGTLTDSGTTLGTGILVGVHDSGPGIPKSIQLQIFDQFFTTKADGLQHGLGLSLVSGLINQMNGKMWVESDPDTGPGTSFFVWFPLLMNSTQPIEKL